MKTLACRDVGIDCDFVAEGMTEEEVMQDGAQHVQKTHPEVMKKMMETMSEADMRTAMIAKMKEA